MLELFQQKGDSFQQEQLILRQGIRNQFLKRQDGLLRLSLFNQQACPEFASIRLDDICSRNLRLGQDLIQPLDPARRLVIFFVINQHLSQRDQDLRIFAAAAQSSEHPFAGLSPIAGPILQLSQGQFFAGGYQLPPLQLIEQLEGFGP